jgi:hypothetical protein
VFLVWVGVLSLRLFLRSYSEAETEFLVWVRDPCQSYLSESECEFLVW